MFLLFFLIKLLFLHTYLISAGLNFYEYVKKNYLVTLDKKPYSRGCLRNIKNRLFKRVPTSKLNLSEINIKEEDLLKSIDKIRSNSILDENDRYKRFPHEENINNLGQSRNEGNNILTATNERQSSLKEKNKNNSNQNSLINSNNANNENSENNDDIGNERKNGRRSIKSNEVNYEFSNNSLNKNRQNLNDSHFKDNENEEIEKDIEIKNFNVSNMTKTQEDVKSIPNIKHEVEIHKNLTNENENENNYPKPIKIKRAKEYKGERRSSKETITSRKMLEYINSDIQIVKNELTQKSENLINQDIMDVQKNYITKTHND
jgi:hypothetical protein